MLCRCAQANTRIGPASCIVDKIDFCLDEALIKSAFANLHTGFQGGFAVDHNIFVKMYGVSSGDNVESK
jgi:hypothetical protein